METTVRVVPEGYHTVTQSLVVKGVDKLIQFLTDGLGAKEAGIFRMPNGIVAHAEMVIGDTRIMLGEAGPEMPAMPGWAYVYLKDADSAYRKALEAGATSLREPSDQFYGDRTATVKDPVGNIWTVATHKEDLSQEEMMRRMAAQNRP